MRPNTEEKARAAIKLVHDSSGDYELHAPLGWHFNEYVNGTVAHGATDSQDHITFHSTREVAMKCMVTTPLILCQDDCAHCNENEEMAEQDETLDLVALDRISNDGLCLACGKPESQTPYGTSGEEHECDKDDLFAQSTLYRQLLMKVCLTSDEITDALEEARNFLGL